MLCSPLLGIVVLALQPLDEGPMTMPRKSINSYEHITSRVVEYSDLSAGVRRTDFWG